MDEQLINGGNAETPSPNQSGVHSVAEPECNCGKTKWFGQHKGACAKRIWRTQQRHAAAPKPKAPKAKQMESHHTLPDSRFAPPSNESLPPSPFDQSGDDGVPLEIAGGAPVHSATAPGPDKFSLIAETFVGLLKGVEKWAVGVIAKAARVIDGDSFAAETLKEAAVSKEEYERIQTSGEVLARKHGVDLPYAEEINFGVAVISPFGRLLFLARSLNAKADAILKMRQASPEKSE
jgi:hypothetical protein